MTSGEVLCNRDLPQLNNCEDALGQVVWSAPLGLTFRSNKPGEVDWELGWGMEYEDWVDNIENRLKIRIIK